MKEKECSKCHNILPHTPIFFHRIGKGLLKLSATCKTCRNEYYRERYKKSYGIIRNKRNSNKPLKVRYNLGNIRNLHRFLIKKKGKPRYCTICNQIKDLDLCSIDHTYTKNIDDYIWLCRSCHIIFDNIRKEVYS